MTRDLVLVAIFTIITISISTLDTISSSSSSSSSSLQSVQTSWWWGWWRSVLLSLNSSSGRVVDRSLRSVLHTYRTNMRRHISRRLRTCTVDRCCKPCIRQQRQQFVSRSRHDGLWNSVIHASLPCTLDDSLPGRRSEACQCLSNSPIFPSFPHKWSPCTETSKSSKRAGDASSTVVAKRAGGELAKYSKTSAVLAWNWQNDDTTWVTCHTYIVMSHVTWQCQMSINERQRLPRTATSQTLLAHHKLLSINSPHT